MAARKSFVQRPAIDLDIVVFDLIAQPSVQRAPFDVAFILLITGMSADLRCAPPSFLPSHGARLAVTSSSQRCKVNKAPARKFGAHFSGLFRM